MAKELLFSTEGRNKLKKGVDTLANAVKVTLGPQGRNVVIRHKYSTPHMTKDGVTVARSIELKDSIEDMGAQMIREVASKTVDMAGDGTTTATVLAQIIISEGLKNVAAGANPMEIKKGIDAAVSYCVKELAAMAVQVGDDNNKLKDIATISANGDQEIGELIAKGMEAVNNKGIITVEESRTTETKIEVVEGMKIERGYISPYFIKNIAKMTFEAERPYIIIADKKISQMEPLMDVIDMVLKEQAPFVLIAEDIEGAALHTLALNATKGLMICALKAPGFGEMRKEMIKDLCIKLGATLVSDETNVSFSKLTLNDLGKCDKIIVSQKDTVFVNGRGKKEEIETRVNQIQMQLDEPDIADYTKEKLLERRAALDGGVAILHVGAATEIELKEKKDRVDDALHATRAAIEEGIIPGGGVAYMQIAKKLATEPLSLATTDQNTGRLIVLRALEEPLRQIVYNSGKEGAVVLEKIRSSATSLFGYDARKEEFVDDMIKSGIIDPAKVGRVALENAASVAGLFLTTECVISDEPEEVPSLNNYPSPQ